MLLSDGPNRYVSNMLCEWRIEAPAGFLLLVEFHALDLEAGFDFVQLYDGTML